MRVGRGRVPSTRSLRSIALVLFTGCYLFGAGAAQASKDDLDQVLRAWVAQNIYFENDRLLLIRKRPVRAQIMVEDFEITSDARKAIANFSDAFGLGVEFTTTHANLIVVTADGIADAEGKPRRSLLARLGATEAGIDLIVKTAHWSKGCGVYNTRDYQGHVSVSIVAGDKSLSSKNLKSCVVTGIIFSFGLRTKGQDILDDSNDYIQFLLLARSLAGCDRKITAQNIEQNAPVRDVYVECIFNSLKAKLSE